MTTARKPNGFHDNNNINAEDSNNQPYQTFAVLQNPDTEFERHEILGEGTYGIVYRATRKKDGLPVALKLMRRNNHTPPVAALREAALLRSLPYHPNVVRLVGMFRSPGHTQLQQLWLVFELCECDLRTVMRGGPAVVQPVGRGVRHIPWHQSKEWGRQLLSGLAHCHAHRLLHRDIKPQNLLIKGNQLRLADFGLARVLAFPQQRNTHQVVTLWYRAPELLLGDVRYTAAVDVWAAGCVITEMLAGRPLFPGNSELDTLLQIFRLLGTPAEPGSLKENEPWRGVSTLPNWNDLFPCWIRDPRKALEELLGENHNDSKSTAEFLSKLLSVDPSQRVTAFEALQLPWLEF